MGRLGRVWVVVAGIAVGFACAAPGAVAAAPSFAAHVDYTIGNPGPIATAIGDFNGDGDADVVAGRTSNAPGLALFLGDGSGVLGAKTAVADDASAPQLLKTGDFNEDGSLDLVNSNGGNVAVLLGNGNGGFGTPSSVGVPASVFDVAVGDLDKDGHSDLIVVGDAVRTFLGDGKGNFSLKATYSSASTRGHVELADLNGDGKLDAVVSHNFDNQLSVFLGDGTGALGTPTDYDVGYTSYSTAVGDFTGDGKLDVVAENFNEQSVSLFPGNGAGALGTKQQIATTGNFYKLRAVDFNKDGHLDVLGTAFGPKVLPGDGQGGFGTAVSADSAGGAYYGSTGDLNGDGKVDVVTANPQADPGSISVLLNNTDLTPPQTTIDSGPSGRTNATSATFTFSSSEPTGGKFNCSLSGPGIVETGPCDSGSSPSYALASEGDYTFAVYAIDKAGNADGSPATRSFTVDRQAPSAPVISSPTTGGRLKSGSFSVSGTAEANSTVKLSDGTTSLGTATVNGSGRWSKALTGVANGPHSYTATAKDLAGNSSVRSRAVAVTVAAPTGSGPTSTSGTPDKTKPKLGSLGFSATVFKAAKSGAAFSSKKAKVGTKVSFTLSEAAKVTLSVERKISGRKSGKRCGAKTKKNAKKRKCTRWVKVRGSFTYTGKPGENAFTFRGRVGGKTLKPGSYRLNSQASDTARNRSPLKRKQFRIVK